MQAIIVSASSGMQRHWLDPSRSVEQRVEQLLSTMSLEEKIGQLSYDIRPCTDINLTNVPEEYANGLGGCGSSGAMGGVAYVGKLRSAFNATRLGIPPFVYAETTHSGGAQGTTVFPMPCACLLYTSPSPRDS